MSPMSVTYFGLRGNLADDCVGPIYRRTQSQAGCCRAALQLDQRGEQAVKPIMAVIIQRK